MQPTRLLVSIVLLFFALIGAVAVYFASHGTRATPTHATVLPEPMPLPQFSLVDQSGNAFTRDDLLGRWHLLFFGFTNCPDICPATLQQLAIAGKRVAGQGATFPGVVLVSVDPERDTPDTLRAYTSHFGSNVVGVTGPAEEIRKLTRALGIYFARSDESNGNYSVDHSAAVLLLNDQAEWVAVFSAPQDIDALVHDVPLLAGPR